MSEFSGTSRTNFQDNDTLIFDKDVVLKSLKDLESLLMDINFERNIHEIDKKIDQLNAEDICNFIIEESNSSLLHLVVNKPIDSIQKTFQRNIFSKLLDKNCDVNLQDAYGFTVLHYCCNYNLIQISHMIVANKNFNPETINLKTTKQLKLEKYYFLIGSTPVQICAWLDHFELAEYLVKNGASINEKNESGWSCIHICARQNHIEFVKFLIKNNCIINDVNENLKTPLHITARHGHANLTKVLLDANADFSLQNKYGQSPLYVGISKGHYEASRILLDYKADPNQPDEQNNTPLHACSMLNEKEMLEVVKISSFKIIEQHRNVRIAETLIQRGSDFTRQNNLGWTALHFAAKMNSLNLASLLIKKSNKLINKRDVYGQTALYLACKWKSIEVETLLLGKLANKDIPDISGVTPLHLCSFESSNSSLEKLLEYGDDVNKALGNKQKDTALHIAAKNNNAEMINLLLKNGADVNKTNSVKQTPLHLAASVGSDQACFTLLTHSAKINKTDKHFLTPFHSCIQAQQNSVKITKMMVDFGSDINKEFENSMNGLALSTMNGNIDVVRFLINKKAKIFNSKQDSIAHLCALKNQCDPECLKLLIDSYGTSFLFQHSLKSFRTPLQLCVEHKSNQFLKALISCKNISCKEWYRELHSINGIGISPCVMAISTKNYEFIDEFIKMWFNQLDKTHHSINDLNSNELTNYKKSYFKETFNKVKNFFLSNKVGVTCVLMQKSKTYHGCESCYSDGVCLFMPDWNNEALRSERYFLNFLIRDNEKLTEEILDTFIKTDMLKWTTLVYLDHVEPYEIISTNESKYERPLTPIETIYIFDKTDLVIHPVIKTLIETKYLDYARGAFWLDTFRSIGLLCVWTTFSIYENYAIRHYYRGENKYIKICLLLSVFIFFTWDLTEEIREIYYMFKRLSGYKQWVIKEYRNLKFQISKIPNMNREIGSEAIKYSLIEKEAKSLEKSPIPYKRFDNVTDWIVLLFQLVSLITHLIDIVDHTNSRAQLHISFSFFTTILIWIRNLLSVQGPGTDLICMVRLIGSQFYRFFLLYIRIIIPFLLILWTMYGGSHIPQQIMEQYWKECESIKFSVPYDDPTELNKTHYSDVCKSSVVIEGFENFYESLFTVFQLIFVNVKDFHDMKSVQNDFSPIVIGMFVVLTNIIGLNFFIGLMSNVLSSGAYRSVESHRLMEILGYVLQHEWRLSNEKRQNHLNKIKYKCSPKILKHADVIVIEKDKLNKYAATNNNVTSSKSSKSESNFQNIDSDILREVNEMRAEIKELKDLLKAQLKA